MYAVNPKYEKTTSARSQWIEDKTFTIPVIGFYDLSLRTLIYIAFSLYSLHFTKFDERSRDGVREFWTGSSIVLIQRYVQSEDRCSPCRQGKGVKAAASGDATWLLYAQPTSNSHSVLTSNCQKVAKPTETVEINLFFVTTSNHHRSNLPPNFYLSFQNPEDNRTNKVKIKANTCHTTLFLQRWNSLLQATPIKQEARTKSATRIPIAILVD